MTALAVNTAQPGVPALKRLDYVGIVASIACVVHCMLAPVFLLLLPVFGGAWSSPLVHWLLAILVLPLAGMILLKGYRRHRRLWVGCLAFIGMAGILAGLILPLTEVGSGAELAFATGGEPEQDSVSQLNTSSNNNVEAEPLQLASLNSPSALGGGSELGGIPEFAEPAASCSNPACCPSVAVDETTGNASLIVPLATIVTLIGSMALVLAHVGNLWSCRCCTTNAPCVAQKKNNSDNDCCGESCSG